MDEHVRIRDEHAFAESSPSLEELPSGDEGLAPILKQDRPRSGREVNLDDARCPDPGFRCRPVPRDKYQLLSVRTKVPGDGELPLGDSRPV
jgi:hypothetical protein